MIELLPGEEVCPKCKGTGNNTDKKGHTSFDFICFRCRGTGKIDWVQKAMGPQKWHPYDNITIPLIRHAYPKLLAEELVGVQPMPKPEFVKGFKKND